MDDDDVKFDLADAENLNGTCPDMCSAKEIESRTRMEELSAFEKPSSRIQRTPKEMVIKRFQRSSADHKLNIPSEVRPLTVLRQTQLYLETCLMDLEQLGVDERLIPPKVPPLVDVRFRGSWLG